LEDLNLHLVAACAKLPQGFRHRLIDRARGFLDNPHQPALSPFLAAANCLLIRYCWPMENRLLTTQYNTSPASNWALIHIRKTGMMSSIARWVGSPVAVILICAYVVTPERTGRMQNRSFSARSQSKN